MNLENDPDLVQLIQQHHVPPESPVEEMWLRVRAAAPARRRHRQWITLSAAIAAILLVAVLWPRSEGPVVDVRRVELDAGWTRLPEPTARALRASLTELDRAIEDLDALLRSDPSNQIVLEMRARFDRQRSAWLDSALQDLRRTSGA